MVDHFESICLASETRTTRQLVIPARKLSRLPSGVKGNSLALVAGCVCVQCNELVIVVKC